MPIELNSLKTARLGVKAARVIDTTAFPDALNAAVRALGIKMLTIRFDCAEHAQIHALEADGHRLMDSLVFYERSLIGQPASSFPTSSFAIRRATPQDAPAVADVARAAFRNYVGHFHSDPRLDSAVADAAYAECAEHSITELSEANPALLALAEGRVAGFLTLRRNSPEEIEFVLNAVAPGVQGQGLYGLLLARAIVEGKSMGGARMIVSTQLNNFTVQRVWIRQGFRIYRGIHTFHKWYDVTDIES